MMGVISNGLLNSCVHHIVITSFRQWVCSGSGFHPFIPNFIRIPPVTTHMKHADMTRPTCISSMCCVKQQQQQQQQQQQHYIQFYMGTSNVTVLYVGDGCFPCHCCNEKLKYTYIIKERICILGMKFQTTSRNSPPVISHIIIHVYSCTC
jgi:hypothetical protein